MKDSYKSFFIYCFNVVKKSKLIVISTIILFFLLSCIITFGIMKPKYTSTTQLLVNQKLSKSELAIQAQQTQTDIQRVFTYKDIITSPVVQKQVEKNLKNEPGANKAKINVQNQQSSQVFSISATTNNPYTSADVANETAIVFQNKIKKIMDVNSVTVVSKATPKMNPTSPHYVTNLVAGLLMGIIVGFSISIFKDSNDRTIKEVDYLTDDLGLNNLGIIANIDDKKMFNKNKDNKRRHEHTRRV
ncbi:YveK family protein [Fructilactobacillus frigidiflavus]|uniref:YveK family protein n=1 Tax=Fructilactobacillus frigidiflavus TaxID=3242688 RepID=UPI00375797CC